RRGSCFRYGPGSKQQSYTIWRRTRSGTAARRRPSPAHSASRSSTKSNMVKAVEHLVQVRALISNGQVSVQLEPGPHIADEPFACFDARLQHDVEDPAASFRQVMGVSNGCLNGISPTLRSRCVSCSSTPPWTVLPLPSQPGDGQQEDQGD